MIHLKKILVVLVFILFLGQFSIAQEVKSDQQISEPLTYYEKMSSSLFTLYKASNLTTFKIATKKIRSIAEEEKTKWVPFYHAAYGYILSSYQSKEPYEIEEFLNQAQQMLDQANQLSPNNDEITALQGFLYQARISFNPAARLSEYSRKAVEKYDLARYQNPENPRPYYLIGQILYRLPEAIGGNKENACKHFTKAAEKFKTFEPRSEFSPNWGEEANKVMLNNCK